MNSLPKRDYDNDVMPSRPAIDLVAAIAAEAILVRYCGKKSEVPGIGAAHIYYDVLPTGVEFRVSIGADVYNNMARMDRKDEPTGTPVIEAGGTVVDGDARAV